MKHIKQKILILVFFLCLIPVYSQEYSFGAIPNPERYRQINSSPVLVTRNYTSDIPRLFSLKQYCPIPENQSPFGTCAAWATTFAARTISESVFINRTDPLQSSNNAFSPYYTYAMASNDPTFNKGMYIGDALKFMKETGAVRRLPEEKIILFTYMRILIYANAQHFPISGYETLFNYYEDYKMLSTEEKVWPVRKCISERTPVIIAMRVPESFNDANGLWQPQEGETPANTDPKRYHAMCVIGYDNDMYGGAFLIQNSWGTGWGSEGFVWVKYNDFAAFVFEAYKINKDLNNSKDKDLFAASIEIEVDNDPKGMPVVFDKQGFYKTRSSYPTGTRFRFLMTNRYPAYVYAFSTDTNDSDLERVFPIAGGSPRMDYIDSTIAWPGEYESMQIFGNAGTDYLVVLYSKSELDIDAIEERFFNEDGTFPERAARAVGPDFIPFNIGNYNENKIEFSATSQTPKAVFGLLLAIEHR